MDTPRDYQVLRDEHARVSQEPTPQTEQIKTPEQAKRADGQQELEPRNYQVLRDEHARETQEQATVVAPQKERESMMRSNQIRAPAWNGVGGLVSEQAAAIARNNWLNANAAERQGTHQNIYANTAEHAAARQEQSGRDLLADDLKEAKEAGAAVTRERDTGHAPAANRLQHENAAVAPEKESGKDLLAADLKEAKESSYALEHGHDTARGR